MYYVLKLLYNFAQKMKYLKRVFAICLLILLLNIYCRMRDGYNKWNNGINGILDNNNKESSTCIIDNNWYAWLDLTNGYLNKWDVSPNGCNGYFDWYKKPVLYKWNDDIERDRLYLRSCFDDDYYYDYDYHDDDVNNNGKPKVTAFPRTENWNDLNMKYPFTNYQKNILKNRLVVPQECITITMNINNSSMLQYPFMLELNPNHGRGWINELSNIEVFSIECDDKNHDFAVRTVINQTAVKRVNQYHDHYDYDKKNKTIEQKPIFNVKY